MKVINRNKNRTREEAPFKPFATAAAEDFVNRLVRTYGFKISDRDQDSITYKKRDVTVIIQTNEDFLQVILKGKVFTFSRIGNDVKFYASLERFIDTFFDVGGYLR